jgi:hypothetical protein
MKKVLENLIEQTEKFLNRSLKRREDLKIILKAYEQNDNLDEFEKLTFDGKYLNGLFRVLKESTNLAEIKSVDHIKKDITETVEKIFKKINDLSNSLNGDEEKILKKNYLELTQNSMQNLHALVEDFDDIKKYLNYLKRTDLA